MHHYVLRCTSAVATQTFRLQLSNHEYSHALLAGLLYNCFSYYNYFYGTFNTVSVTWWPSFGLCVKQASLFFSPCLVVETRAPPTSTMMPYAQFFLQLLKSSLVLCPYFSIGSHTILKVKFLSKNSILNKPQHFREFFTQIFFWQFFSWNQSCQQLKSPKPQHFHEFSPKANLQFFSGNQSWIFGQKMKIVRI